MKWGVVLLLFFLCPLKTSALVKINEFQIEPSGLNQWIELYNSGADPQDIAGWFIDDDGGSTKFTVPVNTVLQPNTCISFQSGSFLWNTASSDRAKLLSGDIVIDEYQYTKSPGSGISFGRSPDGTGGWTTFSSPSRDKLNSDNTSCLSLPTPTPTPYSVSTPSPIPTPSPSPSPTPVDYSNLSISEYFPYPESGNEWAEIYNSNDSEVNLNGWFIDDITDGSSPIGISGIIGAKSYKQFYLADSFLNNGGDDVRLLNVSKTEKNKTSFTASTKAKSWAKDSSGNWCQVDPTPNSSNPNCPTPTPTPTPTPVTSPTPTPKSTPVLPSPTLNAQLAPEERLATPTVLGEAIQSPLPTETPNTNGAGLGIGIALVAAGGLSLLIVGWILWKKGQFKTNQDETWPTS